MQVDINTCNAMRDGLYIGNYNAVVHKHQKRAHAASAD